jgi:hypothetical protein
MADFRKHEWQPPWLYGALGDGWVAAYRLTAEGSQAVVAELRVFPGDLGHLPGLGDANVAESPPMGGLTTRIARDAAAIKPARELGHDHLAAFDRAKNREEVRRHGRYLKTRAPLLDTEPRRPGRRGRNDEFYADIALRYWLLMADGNSTPTAALARQMSYSPQRIRDLVHEARSRGLLTKSPPGRAGGELTPKTQELLAEMAKRKPPSRLDKRTRDREKEGSH